PSFWCDQSCTCWFRGLDELWRDLADVVAGRHNGRSSDRSIDYSLEHSIKAALEQEGRGLRGHPPTAILHPERSVLWRMAYNFREEVPNGNHRRTDCNL